jgi:hypothetical protein
MKRIHHKENIMQLEAFADGEVAQGDVRNLREHLRNCPVCKKIYRKNRIIGVSLKDIICHETCAVDLGNIERSLIQDMKREKTGWSEKNLLSFTRKVGKVWIPATAVVVVALWVLFFSNPVPSPVPPSAFVHSLKADVLSVMILETAGSRQTVLWFEEGFHESGKENPSEDYEGMRTAPRTGGVLV